MLARHDSGATRLYVLGLGAHAIAIAVLLASILTTRPEAAPAPAAAPALEQAVAVELVPARLSGGTRSVAAEPLLTAPLADATRSAE